MAGLASLYLLLIAFVVLLFHPFSSDPLLYATTKGIGMYCSAIVSTGYPVCFDHWNFMQAFLHYPFFSFQNLLTCFLEGLLSQKFTIQRFEGEHLLASNANR